MDETVSSPPFIPKFKGDDGGQTQLKTPVNPEGNMYSWRSLVYCVSACMVENPMLLQQMRFIFEVVIANSMIACIFILVMRVYDWKAFHNWSNGYVAELGDWNLQIADCMLVFSYALTDFFKLRLFLTLACISFVFYSATSPIGIMADMGIFNFVMALLNIRHGTCLLYMKRYIEFSTELEQIYSVLFSRYMTRVQFKELADISVIRQSKSQVTMKEEGDLVTSLCILVKGQVEVRRKGRRINTLYQNETLEAPDWVRSNLNPEGRRLDVGFVTETDVIYIKFTRELLVRVIEKDQAIRNAVLAVLSIRVSELWLRSNYQMNTPKYLKIEVKESSGDESSRC